MYRPHVTSRQWDSRWDGTASRRVDLVARQGGDVTAVDDGEWLNIFQTVVPDRRTRARLAEDVDARGIGLGVDDRVSLDHGVTQGARRDVDHRAEAVGAGTGRARLAGGEFKQVVANGRVARPHLDATARVLRE